MHQNKINSGVSQLQRFALRAAGNALQAAGTRRGLLAICKSCETFPPLMPLKLKSRWRRTMPFCRSIFALYVCKSVDRKPIHVVRTLISSRACNLEPFVFSARHGEDCDCHLRFPERLARWPKLSKFPLTFLRP